MSVPENFDAASRRLHIDGKILYRVFFLASGQDGPVRLHLSLRLGDNRSVRPKSNLPHGRFMFDFHLPKPFDGVCTDIRVDTAMVSVAKKNKVVVAAPYFVRCVWIIARAARLSGLYVADFGDVEFVVGY